jgi:diguanylate cyclase (GGDEF)-like protein
MLLVSFTSYYRRWSIKHVNDTVGHQTGNLLLHQLALCWKGIPGASDALSRLGGDEFVVMLPPIRSPGVKEIASTAEFAGLAHSGSMSWTQTNVMCTP